MAGPDQHPIAFSTRPSGSSTGIADGDARRCWGCRQLWPRASMRWGSVSEGPLFFPRTVRVLRCPDCLA